MFRGRPFGAGMFAVALAVVFFGLNAASYAQSGDEAQIRALEDRFAAAFRAKNVDAIMANYEHSGDLVVFDVIPPRQYVGWDAYKKDWQDFFGSVGPFAVFEITGLTVHAEGNLAWSYSFQHYRVEMKGGGSRDATVRVTDVYRKIGGRWLIVHEHVSVPVDPETGKGDMESKP